MSVPLDWGVDQSHGFSGCAKIHARGVSSPPPSNLGNMLRLLRQPGVRVTTRSIAQQRIQYKGLFYGPTDESKDKDSASQPGDNNRLVGHSTFPGLLLAQLTNGEIVGSRTKSMGSCQ